MADAGSERLAVTYCIPSGTPREPLERRLIEACRRHRAAPGDVTVVIREQAGASASLVLTTRLPLSVEHRNRAALLRDVETILAEAAGTGWRRTGVETGVE